MIRIKQLKIKVEDNTTNNLVAELARRLKISFNNIIDYKIIKQSLDARDKDKILMVYEVDVKVQNEANILKHNHDQFITISPKEQFIQPISNSNTLKVIIIGAGPAGLFAAYTLVEAGLRPIIIERGESIEKRVKTVEDFWQNNILNKNSNVQFGEGGAGTFSDGKLNTLVKDKFFYGKRVLETFVKFGAPEEIMYSYKPHIGTDILRNVIINMREYLISKGTIFRYNSCMTNITINNSTLKSITINNKEIIKCSSLILAIGHSARDTFRMLAKNGLNMESKPFAVGVRIQHSQNMINESQYGIKYKDLLGAANYKLTYQSSNGHGVYTFCMCPGGYVVNASSEEHRLAVNGMSNYKRDSQNANSAIIITVDEKVYGSGLFKGLEFQEMLESKAYTLGKKCIPIQLLSDFYHNQISTSFKSIQPEIKGKYAFTNLNELLPEELNIALKEALPYFETKIKGFNHPDAILAGIESRTSSPIKILRDENYSSNILGIYPCGEGAGYAGGIQTSAIDGIKVAEALIKNN